MRVTPKIKIPSEDSEQTLHPVSVSDSSAVRDKSGWLELPEDMAVLPIRNAVTFPGTVVPLIIRREKSRRLLSEILPEQKIIFVVSQKDATVNNPSPKDMYQVGTAMMILKLLHLDTGEQNLIVQGLCRMRVAQWLKTEPFMRASVEPIKELLVENRQTEATVLNVRNLARRVIELAPSIPDEALTVLENISKPGELADFLAANLPLEPADKQKLLEQLNVTRRLNKVSLHLQKEIDLLELSGKIQAKVRAKVDKNQREYFLHEQLKAIQKELGEESGDAAEISQLRKKIADAQMPKTVAAEAHRQLKRLGKLPSASPDFNVILTYLEVMCELPWNIAGTDNLDVNRAEKILDEDHYDLQNVKKRILEYLAVRKLAPNSHGPILCFVGPPGVGKTSLGQSIARAMGRKFIRMSLGGIKDEAELRGHRRTYIGAMPGRILQEIRKAGTNNPVFMLDELDKVGADFRGDPTSALLEILDPAQNGTFQDHYLNVPFDLSNVLFIATANYMGGTPPALRDRMETIELPGYTSMEKLHIARKFLVKQQLRENGLKASQAKWNSDAIRLIIRDYTREAGVRELQRQIGTVCRGVAAKIAAGKSRGRIITPRLIVECLGPRKYENELALRTGSPGVATGLAYTPVGGTILFVEVAGYPGKGQLILTGHIGEVMKESAMAALSLAKSYAMKQGVDIKQMARSDIHLHVPAGAVPKDGPSAGVVMYTALISLLTNTPVRPDVAMTGEITLRGLVLPIGGVKEKVLGAKQAGIKTVIMPAHNKKDLAAVPDDAKRGLTFHFVKTVDEVLAIALKPKRKQKQKIKNHRRKKK